MRQHKTTSNTGRVTMQRRQLPSEPEQSRTWMSVTVLAVAVAPKGPGTAKWRSYHKKLASHLKHGHDSGETNYFFNVYSSRAVSAP